MPSYLESKASNWSEKTVSDESYTLWFHVSSKVYTFTQIRTALVGRPYRENKCMEIAVNSREFQRIVVLVLFLSSTFQTPFIGKIQIHQIFRTIDWSPFTQEIELTPQSYQKISTFESRPTSNHFWDAIHRSSPRNQLAGTPSDLVLKSMTLLICLHFGWFDSHFFRIFMFLAIWESWILRYVCQLILL